MSLLHGLRRRRAASRATGALADYYAVAPTPPGTPVGKASLLALDCEASGLDPRRDRILAAGWVPVDGLRLRLAGAAERVVRQAMPATAATLVHGLLPHDVGAGDEEGDVLAELLPALAGRVLVAHAAAIELGFLDAACRRHFDAGFVAPAICTLALARRLSGTTSPEQPDSLRLHACRERHGLPPMPGHRAAADAQGAAELLLAQVEALGGGQLPLRRLLLA